MTEDERVAIIGRHFDELQTRYPDLSLRQNLLGQWAVRGPILASAIYEATELEIAGVNVEIMLPPDYPESHPVARETTGLTKEFHTNLDGTLCLGSYLAVKSTFARYSTLLGYMEELVIPFFYAFFYKKKFGAMPFGELSHGGKGLLEYYSDLFDVTEPSKTLGLLRILADDDYRGHLSCPCGSSAIIRRCHGQLLRDITCLQSKNHFFLDYCSTAKYCYDNSISIPREFLSKQILK